MRTRHAFSLSRLSQATTPQLQTYSYSPLPSTGWIRLLEIALSADRKTIRCSLKSHALDAAPPFVCVSYTWGHSSTTFNRGPPSTSRRHESRSLSVHWAPEDSGRIRRYPIFLDGCSIKVTANLRDALRMLVTSVLSRKKIIDHKYFWIDAICVDQDNIAERNAQVANMADIFRTAQDVVVWLGKEDEFTTDALETLRKISAIPEEQWQLVSYTSFYRDGEYDKRSIVPHLSYHNWLGFIALLNRPWFKRAWVVQEIALAKSAVVVCGSRFFRWEDLSKTLAFIKTTKWYHHLSTEKLRHVMPLKRNPGVYRRFLASKMDIGMEALYLDRTRSDLMASGRLNVRAEGRRHKPPLGVLLSTHRFSKCTDPRDKIYAFLGLADKRLAPFRDQTIRPNYSLSVQEVYLEVARAMLISYGHLGILSHVQDPSETRIPDLPSWVPDYSNRLDPYPLIFRNAHRWKANGDMKWAMHINAMLKGQLLVQGFHLDDIDHASILRDESKHAADTWASTVQLALTLDDYYQNTKPEKYRTISRLEVLWRTLTTNTYARQHPAPKHVGELFIDYILNLQIRHRLTPWSSDEEFQPHHSPISQSSYPPWHTLLASEPPDSPYGVDEYKKRLNTVIERMFNGSYSPIGLAQLQHEFDMSGGKLRRLFKTRKKFLGTGPRSLKPGDEVWILAGAAVPFVLRRAPNGSYHLIGETYVYGVMHGETLTMGLPRHEILLE